MREGRRMKRNVFGFQFQNENDGGDGENLIVRDLRETKVHILGGNVIIRQKMIWWWLLTDHGD